MTETIQETRMREAMEPLGEILGSLQLILKQKTSSVFSIFIILIIVAGISFGDDKLSLTKGIFLFASILIFLLILSYFEFKRFRKIEKAYKEIETDPYESKNDLLRAQKVANGLIPVIYPKYSHWIGLIVGFNLPFTFLKDNLKNADNYLSFSVSRFWESPLFVFIVSISFGLLMVWVVKRNTEKTKSEQYLQPLERLQWIIDNYDKPN